MSLHPEAYPPNQQVALQLKQMADRIRRLEGRRSPLPISVAPAAPATTTSTSAVPLWSFTGPAPDGWQITVTVAVNLSADDARAGLELRDAAGNGLAARTATDGAVVALVCQDPTMPLTLWGYVSAGTLSTVISAAEAAPWSEPVDGD